ncbi:fungal-specific transcription factor domain-containing protein [Xylogone sp. PMI_703]|nr:fungal-specific transcription factor domain-containing protein [Xylogone sp. PMI_703]
MANVSTTTSNNAQISGRRVRHSRYGCIPCKQRRLRCSEGRPSCSRCLNDGRSCEYILQLIWQDESLQRGVRHGRGRNIPVSFADPTPTSDFAEGVQWNSQSHKKRHFLNTSCQDIEAVIAQPAVLFHKSARREYTSKLQPGPQIVDFSNIDGHLFQYYESHICQSLTLVDDSSNCFRHIILPLSLCHECIRRSLLAVGALYLSLDKPTTTLDYHSLALRYKQRALCQLRRDITMSDKFSKDHILVSMLLLCLFDIVDGCQTSWATHVSAAASLVDMKNSLLEPSLQSFASKFFATRDVMGRSACGNRSKFQEIAWDKPQVVDKSIGCSSELLSIISSITDLSRQIAQNEEPHNLRLMEYIAALESQLNNLIQTFPEEGSISTHEEIVLSQSSSLIHNSAKIYFHTALQSAKPSTYIIQSLVTEQILIIRNITLLKSAYLWSIFVTALYAHGDEQRLFFLDQLDKLKLIPGIRGSTKAAKSIIQTVWRKRDLEVDDKPALATSISDWVRFVRPMSEGLSLA